ncbi:MAG TPA: GMC family oxidoreductase N-terminal domain-containing protein [Steroidobacteraceae bacterium]
MRNEKAALAERVRLNQLRLRAGLKDRYDFVVCGSGSSGSVVARRLAENPHVSVLLLEAGGDDEGPRVMDPLQWGTNIGSDLDWCFEAQPNPRLHGRSISLGMGKVLGGGSSINAMAWSRGHQHDWDFFAESSGDPAWSYEAALNTYRRIEDWHGVPDPQYRGTGGPVFVQPAPFPNPIAPVMLEGARSIGIPTFENQNGRMMESAGGAALIDLRIHDGERQSVFRSYVFPYMDRPNLTVLTHALVGRVTFQGLRATGVTFTHDGKTCQVAAEHEVVLSLGAMGTPKVLMQSGIGDELELKRCGIPLLGHLPGVGQNFQDHPAVGCIWEYAVPLAPRNNGGEATFFCKSDSTLCTPDLQVALAEIPLPSPETAARFNPPPGSWTLLGGLVRPRSRGRIRLTGPDPEDPIEIHANTLEDPQDLEALMRCVEVCREVGNSAALRPFVKREVMPGNLRGVRLEDFVRNAIQTYHHQSCTAKMGRDVMSVVDARLEVYGVRNLRIADASILPRVVTGNTMAACVIIGERAGEILKAQHRL